MPEVTIKYKNAKALKALEDFAKAFDMVIDTSPKGKAQLADLPIRFAKNPDANSLSGIWKESPVDPEALRKKAWGDRI